MNGATPPSSFADPGTKPLQNSIRLNKQDGPVDRKLHRRKSSISHFAVVSVRGRLSEDEQKAASDEMINQFLRATGGDFELALRRLRDTLRWRQTERVDRAMCRVCLKQDGAHYLQVVGHDRWRRPILYSCLALPMNRQVEDNRRHMIATFEQAIRAMPPGTEQWVWISDFHGFGWRDTDPRLAKIFLDVSARHYPERLGLFYCLDAPAMFNVLWKCIQGMVDPVTRQKVRFVAYDVDPKGRKASELVKELATTMDPPTQKWLLREMAQNRSRKTVKHKVFPYGANFCTADHQATIDSHDFRGTESFVQLLKEDPTVLIPPVLRKECEEKFQAVNNANLASL